MNKKYANILVFFFLLQPIIDILTSVQIRSSFAFASIGSLIRGSFFALILILLLKNKKERKFVFLFSIYSIIEIIYIYFWTKNSIVTEALNLIKIFYLPFLLFYFKDYENEKINNKMICMIYFIYLNLILIPYLFNIGYSMYNPLEDKQGYLGLFYGGNEVSAILIGLLPIVLNYIMKNKNRLLKLLFFGELIFVTIILGTKTLFLGVLLVIGFYIMKWIIKKYKQMNSKVKYLIFTIPVLCILLVLFVLPKTPVYKNFRISMDYYNIHNIKDFVSIKALDKLVFSTRLSYLQNVASIYKTENIKTKIFGLGESTYCNLKDVEIDLFDIFFSIGIIGLLVWIFLFIKSCKNMHLKGEYLFSFLLFLVISCIAGHILIKPMVTIYIAILPLLNKKEQKVKALHFN